MGSPAHVRWAEAYITALREMAPRYGFGFVDGWHKVGRKFRPGVQAAAHLSSYFVGGRRRKAEIEKTVLAGDLPRLVVFVGRELTFAHWMHDAKPSRLTEALGVSHWADREALADL